MIIEIALRIVLAVIVLAIEVILLFIGCAVALAAVAGFLYFTFTYPEAAGVVVAWAVLAAFFAYGLHWSWSARRASAAAKKNAVP